MIAVLSDRRLNQQHSVFRKCVTSSSYRYLSTSRGVAHSTELREVTEQVGNRLQRLTPVRPQMENSKVALIDINLVNLAVLEILCVPSSSSGLGEELSVLSVASASCYSYASGVARNERACAAGVGAVLQWAAMRGATLGGRIAEEMASARGRDRQAVVV